MATGLNKIAAMDDHINVIATYNADPVAQGAIKAWEELRSSADDVRCYVLMQHKSARDIAEYLSKPELVDGFLTLKMIWVGI